MSGRLMKLLARVAVTVNVALAAALGSGVATAAESGLPLDPFPTHKLTELPSLQRGAKIFVNYCLNCHSANMMRYNRLTDIGLTEEQIRDNLLFTGSKIGDPMRIAMSPAQAKEWFGAVPPDLSVIARARSSHAGSGADWLFTFLRSFYRDGTRASGWNNALYPNVGMPHVLWDMQGMRGATIETISGHGPEFERTVVTFDPSGRRTEATAKVKDPGLHEGQTMKLSAPVGGSMNRAEFDGAVGDLVAYITYMSDPSALTRIRLGVWVLMFLALMTFLTWWLNREYWKDIK